MATFLYPSFAMALSRDLGLLIVARAGTEEHLQSLFRQAYGGRAVGNLTIPDSSKMPCVGSVTERAVSADHGDHAL